MQKIMVIFIFSIEIVFNEINSSKIILQNDLSPQSLERMDDYAALYMESYQNC